MIADVSQPPTAADGFRALDAIRASLDWEHDLPEDLPADAELLATLHACLERLSRLEATAALEPRVAALEAVMRGKHPEERR
jgi:hypothetical protein